MLEQGCYAMKFNYWVGKHEIPNTDVNMHQCTNTLCEQVLLQSGDYSYDVITHQLESKAQVRWENRMKSS